MNKFLSVIFIFIFIFSVANFNVCAKDIELKLISDFSKEKKIDIKDRSFDINNKGFFSDIWHWLTGGHNSGSNNGNSNNDNTTPNNNTSGTNYETGVVTASSLNLRKGPSTNYPRISSYPSMQNGTKVLILKKDGNWAKVKVIHNNVIGYCCLQYLNISSSSTNPGSTDPDTDTGNTDPITPPSNNNGSSTRSFIYVQPEYAHASQNFARPDMYAFGDNISGNLRYHLKGRSVVRKSLVPNEKIDYVYFAGHGYRSGERGYPTVPEWNNGHATNRAFYPRDFPINKRKNVNNYVFACCKSLRKNWKEAFSGGTLRTVVGYWETGYAGRTLTLVMKKYAKSLKNISSTNSCAIVNAWASANQQATSQTGSKWARERWAAVGYDSNGHLCYWHEPNVTPARSKTFNLDKLLLKNNIIKKENGTIKIFCDNASETRSLEETLYNNNNTEFVAVAENTDNISIGELSGITRSKNLNSSSKTIKMDSGAIIYSSNNVNGEEINISKEKSIDIAWKFVENNGGMPLDAKVGKVSEIEKEYLDNNKKVTIGYIIHFVHEFNGKNIVSYDGEGIIVTVQNTGVTNYQRMWTNIHEKPATRSAKHIKRLSVKECIKIAADDILKEMNYTDLNELNIVNSELTYMVSSIDKKKRKLKQVYCITADSGHFFLIDPITGELLK